MDRVTIGADCGTTDGTVLVLDVMRFLSGKRSAFYRFRKRLIRILHFQRDIAHPVAVGSDVIGGKIVCRHGRRENKVRLALTQGIRRSLPLAGLQSTVSNLRKAESHAIEIGRLARVANPEFNVVNAFQLEWIFHLLLPPHP